VICQKEEIRLGAQEQVSIHKIHPQDQRLSVFLESSEQLAAYLEGRGAVRRAFCDTAQSSPQFAYFQE
jgi:hypothetical protein